MTNTFPLSQQPAFSRIAEQRLSRNIPRPAQTFLKRAKALEADIRDGNTSIDAQLILPTMTPKRLLKQLREAILRNSRTLTSEDALSGFLAKYGRQLRKQARVILQIPRSGMASVQYQALLNQAMKPFNQIVNELTGNSPLSKMAISMETLSNPCLLGKKRVKMEIEDVQTGLDSHSYQSREAAMRETFSLVKHCLQQIRQYPVLYRCEETPPKKLSLRAFLKNPSATLDIVELFFPKVVSLWDTASQYRKPKS